MKFAIQCSYVFIYFFLRIMCGFKYSIIMPPAFRYFHENRQECELVCNIVLSNLMSLLNSFTFCL